MLENLKHVLLQHKKFLIIFLLIVFLPSIILAIFGIQAINNERYKLQQINLEQQRGLVRTLKSEVQSLIEKEISGLREFSTSRALINRNYETFSEMISKRLQEEAILGKLVSWNGENPVWFPGFMPRPPSTKNPAAPAEWRRFQSDLDIAERSEFRFRNLSEAISLYTQILQRTNDDLVKAWIQSRIARCEVKRKNYKQALKIQSSIIKDFPDLLTESGRPLEIATRMEMLDVLLVEKNAANFIKESLHAFNSLEQKFWSLNMGQVEMYTDLLLRVIIEAERENLLESAPANYQSSISDFKSSMDNKLGIWRMAETARQKLLRDIKGKMKKSPAESLGLQKNTLEFEDRDVLVLLLPLDSHESGINYQFLVSLLEIDDWRGHFDTHITTSGFQGISILLRSNLSDKVLYGDEKAVGQIPVLTDFFSENFPRCKVEVYQNGSVGLGMPLHKNIFFWIILALLVIVFFGSGLIIRAVVQEVNLLNLKSEFIASVSHEFKTPLTVMGAILERLLSDEVEDSKKIQEYYRIMSHDSEKLKRLVKNILDFTKIEDGKREYKLSDTDIIKLIRKEVDSFQKENKMAGFEVEMIIEDNILRCLADEESLSQALHNILDNAAKFSGLEKKIDVNVMRKKERVEIAVLDRGVGIAQDDQNRVFEKFYRGKLASSVSPTGTGLGLTLVKHIMDGHRGDVVIVSQPGKGTCVTLILPCGKDNRR